MLKITNTKHKLTLGIVTLIIPLLSISSLTYLTFTPEYTHAATDTRTLADISTMQEITPTICSNTPEADTAGNHQYPLTDSRDGSTYTVAKLKDGNCWMTQNLALPGSTTLTINDSDLDPSVFTDASKTYTLPAATTSGFSNVQAKDKNGTSTYTNQQVRNPANPDTNKYGAYYSWCAATAGTCLQGAYVDIIPNSNNIGNAGNVANTTIVPANQNATSSICPKGWQLPISGSTTTNKSYKKLLNGLSGSAGSTTMRGAPYNFVYGGDVTNSSLYNAGSDGLYWSSAAFSATNAYYLYFNSSNVYPSVSNARYYGLSVRCVASDWPKQNANIAVTIPPILTIDAASGMDKTVGADGIATGTISATIIANTEYDIKLSSDQPNLQNGSDTINVIKPVPATNSSLANNTWGIRTSGSDTNTLYSPITNTPANFLNTTSTNTNGDTVHTHDIGVKTAPSLPAGTYSTTITITASTK